MPNFPENDIESNLTIGEAVNLGSLDSVEIYPGVIGKVFWGEGTMTVCLI